MVILSKQRVAGLRRFALDLGHAIIIGWRRNACTLETERGARFGEVRIGQRLKQRLPHRLDRRRRKAGGSDEWQAGRERAFGGDGDALDEFGTATL